MFGSVSVDLVRFASRYTLEYLGDFYEGRISEGTETT
jgi:hypothetical protein